MDQIKNYIKTNKKDMLLIFLGLLAMIGIFSLNRSAPDTYTLESYQYIFKNELPYFNDGRFFMTLFVMGLKFFHVSYSIFKLCSWGLAFFSLYASILLFAGMLKKVTKKSNNLLAFLTIVNVFVFEFFIFADYTGIMCFGILNAVVSAHFFLNFMMTKEKKDLFLSMLFSLFTAFCYQGVISLVIILPVLFTLKYSKKWIDFIKNNLWLALVYAVPTFSALLIGKLIGTIRLTSGTTVSFMDRISAILTQAKEMIESTAHVLPSYLFFLIIVFTSLLFVVLIYKKRNKWIQLLFLIYCLCACFLVPLAPQFIIDYNNIWVTPRSSVGLGIMCFIPSLLCFIYLTPGKRSKILLTGLLTLLAVFQFRGYLSMGYSQIRNNMQEELESSYILDKIEAEEKKNGKTKSIAIYPDQEITYGYPEIRMYKDINIRVGATDWGTKAILYRSLNRSLETKEDKEFQSYCAKHNWRTYSDETVKVKDQTLYICIY